MLITYRPSPNGRSVEPAGSVRNFDLRGLRFQLKKPRPRRTRDFTLAVPRPVVVEQDYLSYEVLVRRGPRVFSTLRLAGVRILPRTFHRYSDQGRCRVDMAIPTAVVEAIARPLRRHVRFGPGTVQGERFEVLDGVKHTVFTAWLDYFTSAGGRERWEAVEGHNTEGRRITSTELKLLFQLYAQCQIFAAVAFKPTLSYKGARVAKQDMASAEVELRLNPRAICLTAMQVPGPRPFFVQPMASHVNEKLRSGSAFIVV